jgi:hypothetical protein
MAADVFLYPGEANPPDVRLRNPATSSPAALIAYGDDGSGSALLQHWARARQALQGALDLTVVPPAIPPVPAPVPQQEVWPLHHWLRDRQVYCVALEPASTFYPLSIDIGVQPPLTPPIAGGATTSKGHGFWLKPGPWLFNYGPDADDPRTGTALPTLPPLVTEPRLELVYAPIGAQREAEQQQPDQENEAKQYVVGTQAAQRGHPRAPAAKELQAEQAHRRAIEAARLRHDDEELILLMSL